MIDNPLTAEAGPELDAAIAEEVMGWKRQKDVWLQDGKQIRTAFWQPPDVEALDAEERRWEPSTDANDALIVAEKARCVELPYDVGMNGSSSSERWQIDRREPHPQLGYVFRSVVSARTFPLAICRAALWLARDTKRQSPRPR